MNILRFEQSMCCLFQTDIYHSADI